MDKVLMVGIAGGSGSGKTTFAKKVIGGLPPTDVSIVHMDSYYLPKQSENNLTESGRPNFDHPKAFDWDLIREHLHQLKKGNAVDAPVYDFTKSSRTDLIDKISPAPVIIFEGIFTLFDSDIRSLLDIKCFLHVESDIRFTRRLHRDVRERERSLESVIEQYYDSVRPMYEKFLAPQRQYADFIVGEETDVAARILASSLGEFLKLGPQSCFKCKATE